VETNDEWIASRTGIRRRHVLADGETMGGHAAAACKKALEMAGVAAEDVSIVLVATSTPDDAFGSACQVRNLGLAALCQTRLLQCLAVGCCLSLSVLQHVDAVVDVWILQCPLLLRWGTACQIDNELDSSIVSAVVVSDRKQHCISAVCR
jgi:predicted naringenin-chalcone synthase